MMEMEEHTDDETVIRGGCPNGCFTTYHDRCASRYSGFFDKCCGLADCLRCVMPCAWAQMLLGVLFCPCNCYVICISCRPLDDDETETDRVRILLGNDLCKTVLATRGAEVWCLPCFVPEGVYALIAGRGGRHC